MDRPRCYAGNRGLEEEITSGSELVVGRAKVRNGSHNLYGMGVRARARSVALVAVNPMSVGTAPACHRELPIDFSAFRDAAMMRQRPEEASRHKWITHWKDWLRG